MKTTEQFVEDAVGVHGNKYDYSRSIYMGSKNKVEIFCPIHGWFKQSPNAHLSGKGCFRCGIKKPRDSNRLTQKEFVDRAKLVHGNRYDYSQSVYVNSINQLIIICPEHGKFLQYPQVHLSGHGCTQCGRILTEKSRRLTQQEFLKKCKEVHGDRYDYSKSIYKRNCETIEIICPIHGVFFILADKHINSKHGCPKCGGSVRLTQDEFVGKSKSIHGDRYDYSKSIYVNNHTKIEIICRKHGSFWQKPNSHLDQKAGCPKCNRSKGELIVEDWLEHKGITYICQMKFDGLGSKKNPMKFDFFLPDYNILVEVDGFQHYQTMVGKLLFGKHRITQSEYEQIKRRDELKTLYALRNKIRLIRIPYRNNDDRKNIIPTLESETWE
jgi:hypothetical protein